MELLWVFVLLSAVSTAFAQTFLQNTQRLNIPPPYAASASGSITPEDISSFSQMKEVESNSPFSHIFIYPTNSDDKNDKNSDSQFQQTGLNDSFQNQLHSSDTDDSSINNNPDSQLQLTVFNSPILSKFAEYNLQVQMYANIYPRLYDVSISPDVVRECFHNEAIYFALENGLYEVGSLPQQLADAAAHAFPSLTPLDYFAVISNTLELSLERGGLAIDKNYQALARLYLKDLEDAIDFLKVNNAQSSLHAIIVATGTFFKSLKLDSSDEIKYILSTWADQLSKVSKAGSVF